MNKQEFQLELERFKQKASWETHIFYFILSALWGIILIYFNGIRVFDWDIIWWFLILAGVLIIGEWVLQGGWHIIGFFNVQMEILRKKLLGKDTKIYDENKLRDLVIFERKLKNKFSKKKRNTKKIQDLEEKIDKLKKEIWGKE